ncbi:MAG: response regulator [Lachnospiraceae bacterium]
MRKALIVGELNPVLMNINQCLINEFETQMCEADLETIKKMRKLLQPDLLVISQQGIDGKEDVLILDMLKEKMPKMPIVFIETVTAKNHLSEYERVFPNFVLLKRPIVKSKLINTCYKVIGEDEKFAEKATKAGDKKDAVKKRVMVIDDNPLLLRNMKHLLEKRYQVFIATSGEKALEFIPKKKPDIILLDYEMPGMDGRETFMKIKENPETRNIPVLFLTGISDKAHIYAALELEPAGYILKPAAEEKLFSQIEQALIEKMPDKIASQDDKKVSEETESIE